MGYTKDEELLKEFKGNYEEVIKACLAKETAKTPNDSYIEIY